MDDGIVFPERNGSPGHDIGPEEEYLGFVPIQAILGQQNYNGEPSLSDVVVNQRSGYLSQDPIDTSAEAEPSSNSGGSENGRKYYFERERLKTFVNWRTSYCANPVDLARNGFMHIGPADRVLCVFCLKTINEWEEGDNVEKEHRRIYPNCPFVRGLCQDTNVPISGAENLRHDFRVVEKGIEAKYPAFVDEAIRLESYVNWSLTCSQTPKALAEAGFFYTPLKGKIDRVRCFMCGKTLQAWQPDDDPWVEHTRHSPKCKFVLEMRGQEFIKRCTGEAVPAALGQETLSQTSSGFDQSNQPGFEQGNQAGFDQANQAGFDPANPAGFDPANPAGFDQANPAGFDQGKEAGFDQQGNPAGFDQGNQTAAAPSFNSNPEDDVLNNTAVKAVLQDFGSDYSMEQVINALQQLKIISGPEVTSQQLLIKLMEDEEQSNNIEGNDMDTAFDSYEYDRSNDEIVDTDMIMLNEKDT